MNFDHVADIANIPGPPSSRSTKATIDAKPTTDHGHKMRIIRPLTH